MRTFFGPLHLLFLAESFAHHFVHGRLHEARRNRLTMAIPLAIVRDQMRIVLDVRPELLHSFNQLLKLGGRVSDLYLDMQSEPEFIPIDKQPDDEVMHLNRFGKTDRLTS
jgi:hypothetical protein